MFSYSLVKILHLSLLSFNFADFGKIHSACHFISRDVIDLFRFYYCFRIGALHLESVTFHFEIFSFANRGDEEAARILLMRQDSNTERYQKSCFEHV